MSKYDKYYRVIRNADCNDWNDELEYKIQTLYFDGKSKYKTGNNEWFEIKNKNPIYTNLNEATKSLIKKIDLCEKAELNNAEKRIEEKQETINKINKEFLKSIKDWKQIVDDKIAKIKDLESKLENYSVMNLNGLLADCIIENTENCFDSNVLNLLEKIAIDFSNKLKELKGGESDVKD